MKLTTKPSIDGATAYFTKGLKQLEAVISNAGAAAQKARDTIAKSDEDMRNAQAEIERASRIKAKIEELVA